MSRVIELTRGYVAVVDDEDYEELSRHKWGAHIDKNNVYARRLQRKTEYGNSKPKPVYMHRQILGVADRRIDVDHRDHDGLNNRRQNLRLGSRSQNNGNRLKSGGTSVFKGVCWDPENGKWRAQIHLGGKKRCLGRFVDEEVAAKAYDSAAREQFGEFARLNFPEVAA